MIDVLQPQNYQSSSTLPAEEEEASKDLELALDESFRSILGGGSNKENREANTGSVFKVSSNCSDLQPAL